MVLKIDGNRRNPESVSSIQHLWENGQVAVMGHARNRIEEDRCQVHENHVPCLGREISMQSHTDDPVAFVNSPAVWVHTDHSTDMCPSKTAIAQDLQVKACYREDPCNTDMPILSALQEETWTGDVHGKTENHMIHIVKRFLSAMLLKAASQDTCCTSQDKRLSALLLCSHNTKVEGSILSLDLCALQV